MLVFHRKPTQGVEVKNKNNLKTHDIDYLYSEHESVHLRIDGVEVVKHEKDKFYLDKSAEVLIVIIQNHDGFRIGIGAPRHWNIRRKEVPEKL